jgi:hypothetical protein
MHYSSILPYSNLRAVTPVVRFPLRLVFNGDEGEDEDRATEKGHNWDITQQRQRQRQMEQSSQLSIMSSSK